MPAGSARRSVGPGAGRSRGLSGMTTEGGSPAPTVEGGPPFPTVERGPPFPTVEGGPPFPTVEGAPPFPTVEGAPPFPTFVIPEGARERPAPGPTRRSEVGSAARHAVAPGAVRFRGRSEEPTSELQSLMRISYAVFC